MNIDLMNLGLIVLIPALSVMFICLLLILPELYNEEWYFDDEESPTPTAKEQWIEFGFKYSLIACCISAYIFALAFYCKTFYLLSIFLCLAPVCICKIWKRNW